MSSSVLRTARLASRRDFLRTAVAGSAAAIATGSLLSRVSAQTAPTQFSVSTDKSTDPLFVSTTKIAQLIREKKVSAVDVVTASYKRIDAVNPKINAVVAFCRERALAEAKAADESLTKGKLLGPLHGVPFTVKDSFDAVGVVSTGGTLGRKDHVSSFDATVVARVRAAGAILLGKTNTPEFTLGGQTYNLIYGQTRNPYNPDYSPNASSGGAGAIVAAGGPYFDIGSDYGGSIRGPAFANGIAGLKPTYGRCSRYGHIVGYGGPFDSFQETGPMARRAEDLYLLLSIIGGPDGMDAAMAPVPLGDPAKVDLKNLRIAYYTSNKIVETSPEIKDVVMKTVGFFKELGATATEDIVPKYAESADVRSRFNGADGRDHIRRLLKKHGTTQASPLLGLTGTVVPSPEFTKLSEELDAIRSEQLAWFEKYDLIIAPASDAAPALLTDPTVRPTWASYTSVYNTTGWPAGIVRVRTSAEHALPLGVQLVGQPWRDDVVIAAMSHVESKTGGWQKPPI
jgi:amidase